MITTIILVIASLAAAVFFFYTARGNAAAVNDIADLQSRTQPVDLLAFRNLTDPEEERFLHDRLSPREFRTVQRERLRAAIAYLDIVAANAAVLLRLGEAARSSSNPPIAEAGLHLVNQALKVRLYALSARAQLWAAFLWPGLPVSPQAVSDLYQQLTGSVSRLGYLQNSHPARRIAAIL